MIQYFYTKKCVYFNYQKCGKARDGAGQRFGGTVALFYPPGTAIVCSHVRIVARVYSAFIFCFPIVFNRSPTKAAVVDNKNNNNLVGTWKLDGYDGNTGGEQSTVEAFGFFSGIRCRQCF